MACSLFALVCGACSLFVVGDLSTEQCTTNADCRRFGAAYTCSAGTCISPSAPDGATADGNAADAAPACQSNAQCIDENFGEPYICDKTAGSTTLGKCLSIKQEGCQFVYPEEELRDENTVPVIFGAFMPLVNESAPMSAPIALAYKLALKEIQTAGGLSGGAGSKRKTMAAIFCDSGPENVKKGVQHLTRTLHVPAVISLFSQTDMTTLFQDDLGPTGTFTLNPQDTTEALKVIDAQQLLWHLLGTPQDVALAYRPLVAKAETYVRSKNSIPGGTPTRVAIVSTDTPTETAIAGLIREPFTAPGRGIQFNGKDWDGNGVDARFLKIASREETPNTTYGADIDAIADFGPDIVILLTSSHELAPFVGAVNVNNDSLYEPGLDAKIKAKAVDAGGPARLPVYLLGPRNARSGEFLAYLKSEHTEPSTQKYQRFLGLQYAGAADKPNPQSQYQQYLKRAADENPTPAALLAARSTENYYDAIYWLAYGLYAAGPGAPVNGASFAQGVRKLLAGPEIYPGPTTEITKSFLAISASATGTTFMGALGKPSFDTASGAQLSVGAVYCYEKDIVDGQFKPKYDTYRYDRTTGQFTAPPDGFCFIGF
ncbi:MAG TPA: hypothetical protein VM925_30755 [Labilithrix sp.]|nr:hypothetical protein [Labilithrix sp.]